MWGLYLVAFVIFIIGMGLIIESQQGHVPPDVYFDSLDPYVDQSDHTFAGIVLVVISILMAIYG